MKNIRMREAEHEWSFRTDMGTYFNELVHAMEMLGSHKDTIFIGQAVKYPGTGMSRTLSTLKADKLLEFPVAEEFQLGFSIGMALQGYIPVSIYPRWNFLLLATNQLVNHLDKITDISNGQLNPKVIIRTSVGSERPLHPQHQHVGNYTEAFRSMLTNVDVVELHEPEDILPAYQEAYSATNKRSTILVEYGDYYNEK